VDLKQGSVQAAVLDGFGDVVGGDIFNAFEIGYGAGDFEDADVGVGEEAKFGNAPFHGQVRSKLQSINHLIWEKDLILKYFIILA